MKSQKTIRNYVELEIAAIISASENIRDAVPHLTKEGYGVFDGTDSMQHMFWRYLDPDHPARPKEVPMKHRSVIEDLYRRMDDLVGRTMARCQSKDTLLLVLSDHGFNTFRRGIDLNRWLEENGYLKVDDSRRHDQYLAGVDWSQTRAFAIGLTAIFLNIKDKYAQGIVTPGDEAEALREEIAQRLDSADRN